MVVRFRNAIETDPAEFEEAGSRLYRSLFQPVSSLLAGKDHLLLLPDDVLFEVPFAALRESAQNPYLVERFMIELLPGAWAVEQQGRRLVWSGPFLGVGDPVYNPADSRLPRRRFLPSIWQANAAGATLNLPRLPGTASELKACARVIAPQSPDLLLGPDARWDAIRAHLSTQPRIIHFATHVVPSPDSPRESLLALSLRPNGDPELLTPELIAAHDVRARLVVLSGCRSGSGNIKPGEGLMGLTRAWLMAGAQSVLATYWPTLDDTGSLLEAFYGSFAQSAPPAEALRAAQRAMIARSDYRAEPRYWASCFISSRGL
jgi:CHAT domain-containing protein